MPPPPAKKFCRPACADGKPCQAPAKMCGGKGSGKPGPCATGAGPGAATPAAPDHAGDLRALYAASPHPDLSHEDLGRAVEGVAGAMKPAEARAAAQALGINRPLPNKAAVTTALRQKIQGRKGAFVRAQIPDTVSSQPNTDLPPGVTEALARAKEVVARHGPAAHADDAAAAGTGAPASGTGGATMSIFDGPPRRQRPAPKDAARFSAWRGRVHKHCGGKGGKPGPCPTGRHEQGPAGGHAPAAEAGHALEHTGHELDVAADTKELLGALAGAGAGHAAGHAGEAAAHGLEHGAPALAGAGEAAHAASDVGQLLESGAAFLPEHYGELARGCATLAQKVPGARRFFGAVADLHDKAHALAEESIGRLAARYGPATTGAVLAAGHLGGKAALGYVAAHVGAPHVARDLIPGAHLLAALPLVPVLEIGRRLGYVGPKSKLEAGAAQVGTLVKAMRAAVGRPLAAAKDAAGRAGLSAARSTGRAVGKAARAVSGGGSPRLAMASERFAELTPEQVQKVAAEFWTGLYAAYGKLVKEHAADLGMAGGAKSPPAKMCGGVGGKPGPCPAFARGSLEHNQAVLDAVRKSGSAKIIDPVGGKLEKVPADEFRMGADGRVERMRGAGDYTRWEPVGTMGLHSLHSNLPPGRKAKIDAALAAYQPPAAPEGKPSMWPGFHAEKFSEWQPRVKKHLGHRAAGHGELAKFAEAPKAKPQGAPSDPKPTARPVTADLGTPDLVDIPDVEIFDDGTHRGEDWTPADLDQAVANFKKLSTGPRPSLQPTVVIGHEEDDDPKKFWADGGPSTGIPAVGAVSGLWKTADGKLHASFGDVPINVAKAVKAKNLRHVSAEFYRNYEDQGQSHGVTLRRVALLGGEIPQVKSLADVTALSRFAEPAASAGPSPLIHLFHEPKGTPAMAPPACDTKPEAPAKMDDAADQGQGQTPPADDAAAMDDAPLSDQDKLEALQAGGFDVSALDDPARLKDEILKFVFAAPDADAAAPAPDAAAPPPAAHADDKPDDEPERMGDPPATADVSPVDGQPAPGSPQRDDLIAQLVDAGKTPAELEGLSEDQLAELLAAVQGQMADQGAGKPFPPATPGAPAPAGKMADASGTGKPVGDTTPANTSTRLNPAPSQKWNYAEKVRKHAERVAGERIEREVEKQVKAALASADGVLAKVKDTAKRGAIEAFCELMRQQGRVTPAGLPDVRARLVRAAASPAVHKFADAAGKEVTASELELQMDEVRRGPVVVKLGEQMPQPWEATAGGSEDDQVKAGWQKKYGAVDPARRMGLTPEKYLTAYHHKKARTPDLTPAKFCEQF